MPGVILPPSPSFGGFSAITSTSTNGSTRSYEPVSVAEIKDKAKENAQKASRGVSAISLIKTARSQVAAARVFEASGDLRSALGAFTKAVSLAQMFMDSAELQQETNGGRKGVLFKEFMDFQQHDGSDLKQHMQSVEEKLKELEQSAPHENGVAASEDGEGPIRKPGGSIADRIRALQSAGLSGNNTTKRISRDITNIPSPTLMSDSLRNIRSPPLSPTFMPPSSSASTSFTLTPLGSLALPSLQQSSATTPLTPTSTQQHVFVHPSSLGPPSPTSSTSSSPHASHFNLSEFAQQFPSIDELDEMSGLNLPSVPTGGAGSSSSSGQLSSLDMRPEPSLPSPLAIRPFIPTSKAFPVLPIDPGPRPASTPIKPSIDTFVSRPGSPAVGRSPLSPTVPRKPSNLSLNSSSPLSSKSPVLNSSPSPAAAEREKAGGLRQANTIDPKTLHDYLYQTGFKVLLLDVRTRDAFEREHIRADAVVCLEPSILMRENVSGETIEDALSIAPQYESTLFTNRDKFELVVFYDESSESYGAPNSPFNQLLRAIYERAFKKMLKKMPVLLLGGLNAWKREYGNEVASGGGGGGEGIRVVSSSSQARSMPLVNGVTTNGVSANGIVSVPGTPHGVLTPTAVSDPQSYLVSRPRAGTDFTKMNASEPKSPSPISVSQLPPSVGRARSGTDYHSFASGSKSPVVSTNGDQSPQSPKLTRKPAMIRPPSTPHIPTYARTQYENGVGQQTPPTSPPLTNGSTAIQYPQFSRPAPSAMPGPTYPSPSPGNYGMVSMPPQASINPSPLARRRSDYVDQSQEALSGLNGRTSIDYPNLSSQHLIRLPPAAASPNLERQDNRPRIMHHGHSFSTPQAGPKPPTIPSDYPVTYWGDVQIGTSGLKNLGNTCYMNSTIQCLSATVPFARFFTDGRWKSAINMVNPLGTKGNLTNAFASILHEMWHGEMPYLSPLQFRRSICMHATQFEGSDQHDSQEFLTFLLDGLHEDLNRILQKPTVDDTAEREAELERLPQQIASEKEWKIYRMRNDSLIVDFFQGQFRNRMECLTCRKTSTTYNAFMSLSLPLPTGRSAKVTLQQCLDAFVKEEVMEKSDAWNCPNCKGLRRATKKLSLSRLPPVLLIHLKRFSFKGPFTDKIETFVDFPHKGLDLTNYMPPPLPPGVDKSQLNGAQNMSHDDPRLQIPPYRYDLYGVTNHFGSLSSGHYTAFVASRGSWVYCDDSRVTAADPKEVVGKPAYVLYYKRVKA